MKEKIWLSSPHMGGEEQQFIDEAFKTNWIAPLGPNVDGFEQDLVQYTGAGHAAVLTTGTAAIHMALILLGVGPEDEVICSSFTFAASANPIRYQGATPVFVDSEEQTWNMDPCLLKEAIEDRIRHGKKPAAIILVHLYGMPACIEDIMEIANNYEIPVIEDAAEGLGSRYNGKSLGTFGTFGTLSFNGNKIITTSGGGALLSNEKTLVDRARFLSTQARDDAPHYQHSEIGYNYRMSNIVAGIGRGQMKVLDERIKQRRANFEYYKSALSHLPGITFLTEPEGMFSNRWLTTLLINPIKNGGITSEQVRRSLEKENIESRPLWKPMHRQPVFETYPFYGNDTSDQLFRYGLCLPSGSNLCQEDLSRITGTLHRIFCRD